MRRSKRPLRIASRRSHLARVQAQAIGQALLRLHPKVEVEFVWIESEGDQQLDRPLADAGGKGLFARAVERALLDDRADLAVHSLKDLPADPRETGTGPAGALSIAAVPAREDVRDCLIADPSIRTIDQLPAEATVGTASPRRAAQLLHLRPDLNIELIRGNIETRLRKVLEERQFAATLLAAAGLKRAGLEDKADRLLSPDQMLPAAAQGALAVQCRADDHVTLRRCLPLNDPAAAAAVHAERQVVAALHGDCHSAIAVLAEPRPVEVNGKTTAGYRLRARVLSADGQRVATFDAQRRARDLNSLVRDAVESLGQQNAAELLGH